MKFTRENVFKIIEKTEDSDKLGAVFDWFLIILITLNIAAVIGSSFNNIQNKYDKLFKYFEYFSVLIFTIEYLLRVWTAPEKFKKPSYIRFIFSFMGIIDLCAILPSLLSFFFPFFIADLRVLRVLRLFRLLRVFKLTRYNKSFDLIGRVFKNEKEKLLLTVFIIGVMLLLASSVMYYVENTVQPDEFPNILATLWWAVVTLTTVGYGDVFPITILGKLLSGIISILGIGLIALPSSIITSGLIKEYEKDDIKELFRKAILNELNKNLLNSDKELSEFEGKSVKESSELSKGKYVKEKDLIPKEGKWGGEYIAFNFHRFESCKLLIGSFSKDSPFKDAGIWMMLFVNKGVGKNIEKVDEFRSGEEKYFKNESYIFRKYIVDIFANEDDWVELTSGGNYKKMGIIEPPPNNKQLCFDDPEVLEFYSDNYRDVASVIGKRAAFWYNEKGFIFDEDENGKHYYKIIEFLEKFVGNNKDIK